ncbi:MAG TPA: hypothetical protein VMW12_08975 [Candidatus Dormibacteraeota bacterium]|nr:hypothetical protein [Candidatus Dormibacteraeota bacterium]
MAHAQLGLWVLIAGCIGALVLIGAGGAIAGLSATRLQRHAARTRDAALAIVDPAKLAGDVARLKSAADGCSAELARLAAISAHLWDVVGRVARLLLIVRAFLGSAS